MSFSSLVSTIATLALLLLIGWIAGKLNFIDSVSTERLSVLIVKIGQPFLIINSLIGQEYSPENLKTGLTVLAMGLGMHAFMAAAAFLCAKPIRSLDERKLSEFSMFFANCGFVGFPIVNALYGAEGLFYGAFYIISFHLFVWTWGILIFARGRADIKVTAKSILFNFGTMPCLIGFLIFISRIPLPECVYQLTGYLAGITTPISLMISGANIARRSLKKMLADPRVYGVNAVKLIVMPILVTCVLKLLGLPEILVVFGAIMAAMPSAAVVTMFGELYRINPGYAAELVGSSTLFCSATIIPVVSFALWIAAL